MLAHRLRGVDAKLPAFRPHSPERKRIPLLVDKSWIGTEPVLADDLETMAQEMAQQQTTRRVRV